MDIIPASKGIEIPSPGPGVVFTAPSGVITIVSSIIVTSRSASTINVTWTSLAGTGGNPIRIFPRNFAIAANSSAQESDPLILYPLDTINADSDQALNHIVIMAKALGN